MNSIANIQVGYSLQKLSTMTFISPYVFNISRKTNLRAPLHFKPNDVSIVIPVKNNQRGINHFLYEFLRIHDDALFPKEIIFIDNHSIPKITLSQNLLNCSERIRLLLCKKGGPASARNLGWRKAQGTWVLFTDSDCLPSNTFLSGYDSAMDGSIGYAGNVKALGSDRISQYYNTQQISIPWGELSTDGHSIPQYLITANALVWRESLKAINGLDERFEIAAGEDIDLGLRLSQIGSLSYARQSVVYHNYDDGLLGFMSRFYRYGRGNAKLGKIYSLNMKPLSISPNKPTKFNHVMAKLQYWALLWGYRQENKHSVTL